MADSSIVVGTQIRELRELARLTQADMAEIVGTTQQTVARIERGETLHSRYIRPMLDHLLPLVGALETRALKAGFVVPSYNLHPDWKIEPSDIRIQIHFEDLTGQVYSAHLTSHIRGPAGDMMFRAGDNLIIDPGSVARHYDWCLLNEGEGESRTATPVLLVDLAEMPPQMGREDLEKLGFHVLDRSKHRSYHKVIARYFA